METTIHHNIYTHYCADVVKLLNCQHCHDIVTTLPECCVNVVIQPSTTLPGCTNIGKSTLFLAFLQHCVNIARTFRESEIQFPIFKIKFETIKSIYLIGKNNNIIIWSE